ncbi:PP2C family protein-serine/threonine phosphatase [Streptomyces sp. NPDC003393]
MIRIRAVAPRRMRPGAAFLAVGAGLVLHARRAFLREPRQVRAAVGAARSVPLRPLPPRLAGLDLAAAQLPADRDAAAGGDLYEVIATAHGVRAVIGDVRGHGPAALDTVAAVLAAFRAAAPDEPDLAGVLRRLDRALARHVRAREPDPEAGEHFVTVLLLQIAEDGTLHALNCGHPWPYRLNGTEAEPLSGADPLPPLGPFPLPCDLPAEHPAPLVPGETLVLYTDGVEDARNTEGRFFPLPSVLTEATRAGPLPAQAVLRAVFTRLLHHTGRRPTDDAAVVLIHNAGHVPGTEPARRGAGLHR